MSRTVVELLALAFTLRPRRCLRRNCRLCTWREDAQRDSVARARPSLCIMLGSLLQDGPAAPATACGLTPGQVADERRRVWGRHPHARVLNCLPAHSGVPQSATVTSAPRPWPGGLQYASCWLLPSLLPPRRHSWSCRASLHSPNVQVALYPTTPP